jgi:putative aldouronate transport system permease protein
MKRRGENRFTIAKLILGTILSLMALTVFIPIANLFAKALSHPSKVYLLKGYDIWPKGFSFIHFDVVLRNPLLIKALTNSLFITIVGTCASVFLTTMGAYVLTRRKLIGKTPIMIFLIIVMIFEPGLIQEYMVIRDLHLLDSLWSMVLYRTVNVFYLVVMMRFIEDIPESLIEAARIDGASHMKLFLSVVIPLARIPMLTIGMFYAVARWNEFFKSSIFLSSRENTVLQVLLRQFVVEGDTTTFITSFEMLSNSSVSQLDFSALKAATIIVGIIPILTLYPIILKYYTKGAMDGGVKE